MTPSTLLDRPPPAGARPALRRSRGGRPLLAVLVVVAVLAAAAAWAFTGHRGAAQPAAPDAATSAARAFFDQYLDEDGRVVRRDQGGDTVSEGQAYALLLAVATDDQARFDRVWRWAAVHLARPDGLWAWRWADGAIADPMPASDADLDAAWALSLASIRFGEPRYGAEATRMASAILTTETVEVDGHTQLAAGPWAVELGVLNPGYAAPQAMVALGRVTGDDRWLELAQDSRDLTIRLAAFALPPDWARRGGERGAEPAGPPDRVFDQPGYGLEASRATAWLATDCDATANSAAARWAGILANEPESSERALDGAPRSHAEHAASASASALALAAAGRTDESTRALDGAAELDRTHPSYYGSAWIALGRELLEPDSSLACPDP